MLSLNTNLASLTSQSALSATQKNLSTSMARLGTGYRINSAMDDAAGLQIATRLDAQTRGMAVAQRNAQNGISLMQTAEGAFKEVTDILMRMKDLATQAADATSSAADKTSMQAEYDALGREVNNVMKNTTFGGQTLFEVGHASAAAGTKLFTNGSATGGVTFQIGASAAETMTTDISASMFTLTGAAGDLATASATFATPAAATVGTELTGAAGAANATITKLDTALATVSTVRSALGAASNRLDHVYNNLANMSTNTAAAKGRIMDVDYATETANMTSKQMLMQAGTSMLKQSNSMSQMVMSLMQ